ncbi:hypothetical protein CYFUS_008311 [Cystobacter fuscus]|uniref:Uncharacterized protein n=1 Tax=Cystobacter fuscus TaxID=43 RepID=A0A250JH71_9BACT|nr:hypothetical protein CYFUS_008311 [Cystobacter fuscus]
MEPQGAPHADDQRPGGGACLRGELPGAREDWRREGVALLDAWRPYTLPEPVHTRVLKLMDALGLNYGAFDFIVTPEGRHVFLESVRVL